jgi:molecular chaperone GrpE
MSDENVEATQSPEVQNEDAAALAAVTAERDRFRDAALRALADLDNYRKRSLRERDEAVKKAREDQLRDLLPVFDNLERASQYVSQGADAAAIGKGVDMVLKLFEDTLGRLGGRRVAGVGHPFDPQLHEAISQVRSEQYAAGSIVAEVAPGYVLGDRLLRAAMVVVSTGPGPAASAEGHGEVIVDTDAVEVVDSVETSSSRSEAEGG